MSYPTTQVRYRKRSVGTADTVVSPAVSITNNAAAAVVPLDAYDPSTTPSTNQLYELPLTIRATSTGSRTIDAGATATVPLDATRNLYDFLFARPADLFPVQNSALMQNVISGAYPPLTIDAGSAAQAALAMRFYVQILAFPTSNLAVQYAQVLSNATANAQSPEALDAAIAQFFQGTNNYQSLTLDAVVAAQTYTRGFAYVWAGFASDFSSFNDNITFYLYSAGTAPAGSNQAAPSSQGTLVLTKTSSAAVADPTDRTGGYTITYNPPSGTALPMSYVDGQFDSDPSADFPAIALRGSFLVKSSLTNLASDNVIIPVVSGQVNGVQVLGTTIEQNTPSSPGFFYTFTHPQGFLGWLSVIGSVAGVLMTIDFLGKGAMWLRNKWRGQPTEIEQLRAEVRGLGDQVRANNQQALDRLGNNDARVPAADAVAPAQADARALQVDAGNVNAANAQLDALQAQGQQIEVLAEVRGVDPQLAAVAQDVRVNAQALEVAIPQGGAQLGDAVAAAGPQLQASSGSINQIVQASENDLGAAQRQAISEASQAESAAKEVSEQAQDGSESAGEGEDPDLPVED